MKKTWIGGIFSFVGSLWSLAIMICAGSNLVDEWDTALGRFWSTVVSMRLIFPFIIAAALAVFGVIIVLAELFRKEK